MPGTRIQSWVSQRRNSSKNKTKYHVTTKNDSNYSSHKRKRSNDGDSCDETTFTEYASPNHDPVNIVLNHNITAPPIVPVLSPTNPAGDDDPTVPISWLRLHQWQIDLQQQQFLLQEFQQRNQSIIEFIQQCKTTVTEIVLHQDAHSVPITSRTTTTTSNVIHGDKNKLNIDTSNSISSPCRSVLQETHCVNNRVSLELSPTRVRSEYAMESSAIDTLSKADTCNGSTNLTVSPLVHGTIRANELVENDADDESVPSTQTIDPTKNDLTSENIVTVLSTVGTVAQQRTVQPCYSIEVEKIKQSTVLPSTSPSKDMLLQSSSMVSCNIECKRPFQLSSTNMDNRKTRTGIATTTGARQAREPATCHLVETTGKHGWVSNQPARLFIRQMDEQYQRLPSSRATVGVTNTTSYEDTTDMWTAQRHVEESKEPSPCKYAYKEVVRNQRERQKLNCYDCPNCRKFYAALHKVGHEQDISILFGADRNKVECSTTTTGEEPSGGKVSSTTQAKTSYGRHRARFAQSETPDDFWELDFIDERDAATANQTISKKLESTKK
jgi:DNA repair protein endonuclease SAE2/CtIP C-terminus